MSEKQRKEGGELKSGPNSILTLKRPISQACLVSIRVTLCVVSTIFIVKIVFLVKM
jgi:hypothetical protein